MQRPSPTLSCSTRESQAFCLLTVIATRLLSAVREADHLLLFFFFVRSQPSPAPTTLINANGSKRLRCSGLPSLIRLVFTACNPRRCRRHVFFSYIPATPMCQRARRPRKKKERKQNKKKVRSGFAGWFYSVPRRERAYVRMQIGRWRAS